MVEINLLPWRSLRKVYEKKRLRFFIVISFVLSLLIIIATHSIITQQEKNLKANVLNLQTKMQELNHFQKQFKKTKKSSDFLANLSKNILNYQAATSHLLAALTEAPIKNLCFNKITREKDMITLSGYTRSVADLSDFLLHFKAATLFSEIKIDTLSKTPSQFVYFKLLAKQKADVSLGAQHTEMKYAV